MTEQSATASQGKRFRSRFRINPVWILLALLIAAIIVMNPGFAQPTGYMNFLKRAAPLAILAAGQVWVITSGGFDLSVGSLITLVVVGASMLTDNDPSATYWVIPLMLMLGLGVGAINGMIVCFLRVPSLIATLGMMITLNGVAFLWSGGAPRGYLPDTFRFFGRELIRDVPLVRFIPVSVIVLIVVVGLLAWAMHRTNLGRMVHALGDNPVAAQLAGVPINRVRISAFMISGLSGAIAGILLGGFAGVSTDVGTGYELQAITAAVLGGAQLLGGRGSVPAAVGGALALTAIFTLLNFIGLPQPVRQVVQGAILIAAVALAMHRRKRTGT